MRESSQLQSIMSILQNSEDIEELNLVLKKKTRIKNFFNKKTEIKEFLQFVGDEYLSPNIKKDLGDFQTPSPLTDLICSLLSSKFHYQPNVIIEPTCGNGTFILSALQHFPMIEYIYAIDIQKKYEWALKFNLLMYSIDHEIQADIEFHLADIFTHIFSEEFSHYITEKTPKILILGNPPWITTTELSLLNSKNHPYKSNFKAFKGIEAITGKGNFDITESIITRMIKLFRFYKTKIAILCKTSVIRNLIRDIDILQLNIRNNKCYIINSKKEFGINVDAALFLSDIAKEKENEKFCYVYSLYNIGCQLSHFGYIKNHFVSNIELYNSIAYLEGTSPFQWRHGIKNDAQKVFMLTTNEHNQLVNGFHEYVSIEPDLLYPFIKSSQIKKSIITDTKYKILITQHTLQEDPVNVVSKYPQTWTYLIKYSNILDQRKSIIYKKRPRFCIFGIGDYCFYPYKIAISGMYKKPLCALIMPINTKPVMLDDTCYYLSFNDFKIAFFTWLLLNMDDFKNFLLSISFLTSKRPYTKEVLMRVDIPTLARSKSYEDIRMFYENDLLQEINYNFTEDDYLEYTTYLETINIL